jgi:hypothetical protein
MCRDACDCWVVRRRSLRKRAAMFGGICPVRPGDTERSPAYVRYMLSTLLVIAGVLVGLLVLLALIVSLSARPQTVHRKTSTSGSGRSASWVVDAGRPHPDAWSPLSTASTSEMPAVH